MKCTLCWIVKGPFATLIVTLALLQEYVLCATSTERVTKSHMQCNKGPSFRVVLLRGFYCLLLDILSEVLETSKEDELKSATTPHLIIPPMCKTSVQSCIFLTGHLNQKINKCFDNTVIHVHVFGQWLLKIIISYFSEKHTFVEFSWTQF